jgi:hypothetical protein
VRARRACRVDVFRYRRLNFNENDAFWGEFLFAALWVVFDFTFIRTCRGMSCRFGDKYVYFYKAHMGIRFLFLQKEVICYLFCTKLYFIVFPSHRGFLSTL